MRRLSGRARVDEGSAMMKCMPAWALDDLCPCLGILRESRVGILFFLHDSR
jgi:hypothetical protein